MNGKSAKKFEGKHAGETMIIVGGAPSIAEMDMSVFEETPSISCNCILRHGGFLPTYLVFSDRRPYIREMEEGRVQWFAEKAPVFLSETIFDPAIRCANTPVQDKPDFTWYSWRVGTARTAFNWNTFAAPLCSFATTGGQILQMAVMMGAKRIGLVGLDMYKSPKESDLHFYKNETSGPLDVAKATIHDDGRIGPQASMDCFAKAKLALDKMGVEVVNISPWTHTPMANIFGSYDYERFAEESRA